MIPPFAFFWMMFPLFLIAANGARTGGGRITLLVVAWLQAAVALMMMVAPR